MRKALLVSTNPRWHLRKLIGLNQDDLGQNLKHHLRDNLKYPPHELNQLFRVIFRNHNQIFASYILMSYTCIICRSWDIWVGTTHRNVTKTESRRVKDRSEFEEGRAKEDYASWVLDTVSNGGETTYRPNSFLHLRDVFVNDITRIRKIRDDIDFVHVFL